MLSPAETLQKSFPGPRLAGVAFVLAPIVLLAGTVLLMAFETGSDAERQARIAAEPLRAELGLNLYMLGWPLVALCVVALASLVAAKHPVLAALSGTLALAGVVVSIFWGGIAAFENGIATMADREAASAALASAAPPVVVLFLLPDIPLGWPFLAYAAWRADVLTAWRAVALAVTGTLPFWVLSGFASGMPIAFLGMAVGFVPLGIELMRGADEKKGAARASAR